MFVGREKELKILEEELNKNSSAVLVYGKRKIGKTTLINQACKKHSKPFIYFECIKDSEERNVEEVCKILKEIGLMSDYISLPQYTFIDLFRYLDSLKKNLVVVIDEYPYLKEFTSSSKVDSVFQTIIDNYLKNINLIISGSHIGMMKNLLEEKNALFGRFNKIISLKELSYLEASNFYPNKTPYEKVAFYAVFGGSPFVNEQIKPEQDLKNNIINLLFDKTNAVYYYASSLLISDLSNQTQAGRICSSLSNGKKSYSELEEMLDRNKTGLLSKQLKPLLEMELIKKVAPINKINDAKKSKYEINDNLIRFYYRYVLTNQYLLSYKDLSLIYEEEIAPTLINFISLRFEEIAKDFMWRYVNTEKIKNVVNIGRYYYDDPVNKTNGEFDLVILNKNDTVQIFEVKYLKNKVDQIIVNKELSQVHKIKELKVDKIGFIAINGFANNVTNLDYMFDGSDLFKS